MCVLGNCRGEAWAKGARVRQRLVKLGAVNPLRISCGSNSGPPVRAFHCNYQLQRELSGMAHL